MQSSWWVERQSNGGGKLVLRQKPAAEPGPGQLRVKIRAVSLNHLDLWVRKGVEGHTFPLPLIGGCDAAVEIDKLGPDQPNHFVGQVGDRGLVYPVVSCGECKKCLSNRPECCSKFGILGETQDGFLSETQIIRSQDFISLPGHSSLSLQQWACLPIAGVTAWSLIERESGLQKGDWILVHAAGSGVSHFAMALAKARGAVVVATARGPDKCARAIECGADHVIDTAKGEFRKSLRELLKQEAPDRRGVDVVLDHLGEATFSESMKCLEWGGRLLTCGATTGGQVALDLKALFFKSLSIQGVTMGPRQNLIDLIEWIQKTGFCPQIAAEFSFDQVPEAYRFLEESHPFGKVVVYLP